MIGSPNRAKLEEIEVTDQERIAQFLATKGVTVVPAAVAYGVDEEADRAKRKVRYEQRAYDSIEREAENRFQRGVEENGYYKS